MNQKKIYVDALPCKISWTTPLLLICILASIAPVIVCLIALMSTTWIGFSQDFTGAVLGMAGFSALSWIVFFSLFANACKGLPHHISAATLLMSISGGIGMVADVIYGLGGETMYGVISGVLTVCALAGALWLGNTLRNNFSSMLGEIGESLRKIVIIMAVVIILSIVSELSGFYGGSVCSFIALILELRVLWILIDNVILPIYQMLHWGHQERITQNDIRNWVAESK